ncbi:MAG: TonB-dependent receptor [Sphingobacteriales bacterium]|nr:TonB-dependent receptor [Sphingobacteriales bacterium]
MKQYSLLFTGLFSALIAFSQQKISLTGKVTDARTGEPLPGATIYLADDKVGTSADSSGRYILKNISPGHHVVEVSFTGYGSFTEHIEITRSKEKNFSLSTVVIENEAVIVTGVAGATAIKKSPVPVTSLRKNNLVQATSANIIDALTHVPGVSQISTGPSVSKPVIRGLGYNRIVIINEGIRQEGQQWGDEHGVEIDELSVGRVEILKGPASLMYGSDALAGVINFITHTPVAEGMLRTNILSNYQSNNGLFAINGNVAANKHGLNWNLYGTYKSAGNYKNRYDGKVLNSGFNEKNFGGYIGLNKSWGYSHFIFSRFYQNLGLVEGDRDDATGQFILFAGSALERIATPADLDSKELFIPRQRVQHSKFITDNNFSINKSRLKIIIGYQNNLRSEFGNPEIPAEKSILFDLKTINYNVQWQFPEVKEWHTTIGVNGMSQRNYNKGVEALIPEYNLFDIGAFVYVQRLFKKATISGGLRYDSRSVDAREMYEGSELRFAAFTRSFSNFSGSAGVSFEITEGITLKANMARGFRAPTLAELSSNGAHEGTNRYEYGDRRLKSETSFQLDGGLGLENEHLSFEISSFYNRIRDFIFYRKLQSVSGGDSLVNVGGEFITAFQFDQHNAKLAGVELQLDIHPHPVHWLHFENTFSFVRGMFDQKVDGTNNLPLIPATRWITELRADIKKAGHYFSNLYVKTELDNTFKQDHPFTGFSGETSTNGYSLLNAGLGSDIITRKRKILFSIHIAMNNITDKAYQNHLSRLKYTDENNVTGRKGVFNTGRNFSIKLNVPLNFTLKRLPDK